MLLAEKLSVTNSDIDTAYEWVCPRKVKRRQPKVGLVVAMILLTAIGNMILQGMVIHQNNQIKLWQKKITGKEYQLVKLRMKIAQLESFDRIQSIAQNELGMRNAGSQDYDLIRAVPNARPGLTPTGYIAKASEENGLWGKFSNWLGGFGRTMAKNP